MCTGSKMKAPADGMVIFVLLYYPFNSRSTQLCTYVCMYACMHVCMYVCGWMDAWMHGCMDGCMDGWMHGWMDAWMDVYVYININVYCIHMYINKCIYKYTFLCIDGNYI